MRGLVVLPLLAAGCSFEHGLLPDDDHASPPDAAVPATGDAPLADASVQPSCDDDDGDGVCNEDDDWPCGGKPDAPPASVTLVVNDGKTRVTITLVTLDIQGQRAVARPNENLQLTFTFSIRDTACGGNCRDQIEVGWVPGNRLGCPFDNAVDKQDGAAGVRTTSIRAPNQVGVYDLRFDLGQNYSCNHDGANTWWNGEPPASQTIAKLCVH